MAGLPLYHDALQLSATEQHTQQSHNPHVEAEGHSGEDSPAVQHLTHDPMYCLHEERLIVTANAISLASALRRLSKYL